MKKSILVVDDEELERELLRQIFEQDYNVIMACNGKEALMQLTKHYDEIVIILLDIAMPVLNGYQVLQVIHASDAYRNIPVTMITASDSQDLTIACYTMGAVSVINKPFSAQIIKKQIMSIIEMYQSNSKQRDSLTDQLRSTNYFYSNMMDAISGAAEFRMFEAGTHIKNVKGITKLLAEDYMRTFSDSGLTPEKIDMIVQATAFHDIGKLQIPDSILLKPGDLTTSEREVLRSHTTKGCEIINLFADNDVELFRLSYDICRSHHEHYDGSGYPDGLSGNEIPLAAQLVSIAHAYDSLIGKRVYKQPYSKDKAYKIITVDKRKYFSPKVMQCFEKSRQKIEMLVSENSGSMRM